MTQPTAEAYEAARVALDEFMWEHYDESIGGDRWASVESPGELARPTVDAVWPLAVAEGRRLEAERLAPLVEAAKNWREFWRGQESGARPKFSASALVAAVDALTRGDTP